MFLSDWRKPKGPGIWPLQHRGFDTDGWELDSRSSLLAVRVTGRLDGPGDIGHWLYESQSAGDIRGGLMWPNASRPIPGWGFAFSCMVGAQGSDPSQQDPLWKSDEELQGLADQLGMTLNELKAERAALGIGVPKVSSQDTSGGAEGQAASAKDAAQKAAAEYIAKIPKTGLTDSWARYMEAVSGQKEAGAAVWVPGQGFLETVNLGVIGGNAQIGLGGNFGAFGINPPANAQFGQIPGAVFGLNVDPWEVQVGTVIEYKEGINKNPDGSYYFTRYMVDKWGNPVGEDGGNETDTGFWAYSEEVGTEADVPEDVLPVYGQSWASDGTYRSIRMSKPNGWPSLPLGCVGITVSASDDAQQVEHFHPTDPRLIAVNNGSPTSVGSLVCDVKEGAIDIERSARLQSMMWVVKNPSGETKTLKANKNKEQNWLSWNIGPSGQWDVGGGMVTGPPREDGFTGGKTSRVHAMVSADDYGPFCVGSSNDPHQLGKDADGNPINALHISTGAYFRFKGAQGDKQDGPLAFEYGRYPGGGDFDYPLKVHLDWDQFSWKWWTTTPIKPPGGGITPKEVPPTTTPPEHPPGGSATPEPVLREPGVKDNYKKTAVVGASASHVEISFPQISFKPSIIADDAPDTRNLHHISSYAQSNYHDRAPTVMRLSSWGAQGPSATPQDGWVYRERPTESRNIGGSAAGGTMVLAPQAFMSEVDQNFQPPDRTLSTRTYFGVGGEAVRFAAGYPILETGGLRDGYSWGKDGDDLVYYHHDPEGVENEVSRLTPHGFVNPIATMRITTSRQIPALGSPVIVDNWDEVGHVYSIIADAPSGHLTSQREEIYLLSFSFELDGDVNETYRFEIFKNGSPTGIWGHAETSGGLDNIAVRVSDYVTGLPGDVFAVYLESTDNDDVIVLDAVFQMHYISAVPTTP